MTKFRTSAIALVLAAAAATGMTGCSKKEAPKAKDAWNKAQDTLGTYKSLEIKGDGTSDGKPATLTAKGDVNGGTLSAAAKIGNGTMDMIQADSKSYMKADEAFFKETESTTSSIGDPSKLAGKWIEIPSGSNSSDSGFKKIVDELKNDSSDANKKLLSDKATVSEDKIDGKDAWKITSEDKKVNAWVSQDDSRDILKTEGFESATGSSSQSDETMKTVTFLSHDKDYGIKAPSGAKNMSDLMSESMK